MTKPHECPHTSSCEMYDLLRLAGTLAVWKSNYCNGDHERCERFKLAQAGRPVPKNLMPNGVLLRHAGQGESR
jgi:hypothetical protein